MKHIEGSQKAARRQSEGSQKAATLQPQGSQKAASLQPEGSQKAARRQPEGSHNAHKLQSGHLMEPSPLVCACLCCSAVPIKGKERQQQVGHELAYVKGDGPIHRKLSVYGIRGVLSNHEAACVHVPVQQGLALLHKLGLQATERGGLR